jgi:hypothetical protein
LILLDQCYLWTTAFPGLRKRKSPNCVIWRRGWGFCVPAGNA